jgi:hypothetical protein
LSLDGRRRLFKQYDNFDEDTFYDYLKRIHYKFQRCYLFLDKAHQHYKTVLFYNTYTITITMSKIADKVKEKLKGTKEKVTDTSTKAGISAEEQEREFKEGAAGTEIGRKEDPLKEYREKEPMTPAKEAEHEPTAVHREMTEKITEGGKEVPNPEATKERARRSGMAKGTAGAAETGDEYEQGAAGTNK